MQLVSGAVSVTGNFRENNEDRCKVGPQQRYFLVADGMGGQAAGEKASELATELVAEKLEALIDFDAPPSDQVVPGIDEAVAFANQEIIERSDNDPLFHNMGTTLAFVVAVKEALYVGGIGDSRVYRLRGTDLEQLTKDHSLTQALLDAGTISPADALTHRYRNVLYRYLGTKEGSTGTEARQIQPEPGDRFLICSDGVTDGLKDEAILSELQGDGEPEQVAQAIVDAALESGSRDNVTALVIFVE